MKNINWQAPSLLENIKGYGDYILEIDDGIGTKIIHAIHLDLIDCFWDVTVDYFDDGTDGFIGKENVLRFVEFVPMAMDGNK